ncbi:DUF7683 domain-containing protein [Treponema saccharophilum]|uniref:DUF7683 domain-containing protein n=1 Tax=Treponema saccharophilum TaxID=165 RepID=UPI0005951DCD|nr:AAC(3) family N-acetyltransferase [Treponema saccharophilum]
MLERSITIFDNKTELLIKEIVITPNFSLLKKKYKEELNTDPLLYYEYEIKEDDVVYQDEDFNQIGSDFEKEFQNDITVFHSARIGNAECKLINQKVFVDFAVNWMNKNRT